MNKAIPTMAGVTRFIVLILVTHAIAFFAHEFAHSFVAWALGAKADPLALDYGGLSPNNVLLQVDIDENVDYAPLFAAGRSGAIVAIAAAGVVLGNALPFFLLDAWLRRLKAGTPAWTGLFLGFLALMCAGNVLGYIPTRVITTHGDMATVARGLGWNAWLLMLASLPLTLVTLFRFFDGVVPAVRRFTQALPAGEALLVLSAIPAIYFGFFGSAVTIGGGYGEFPQLLGAISLFVLLPLGTAYVVGGAGRRE